MKKFGEIIGEVIRKQRKTMDMTAEELANRVGVDRTYLSKIERHNITPSFGVLIRIAATLELDSLIDNYSVRVNKIKLPQDSEVAKEIYKDYKQFTMKQKTLIWKQIATEDNNSDSKFAADFIKEEYQCDQSPRKISIKASQEMLVNHIEHWRRSYNKFITEYKKAEAMLMKEAEI